MIGSIKLIIRIHSNIIKYYSSSKEIFKTLDKSKQLEMEKVWLHNHKTFIIFAAPILVGILYEIILITTSYKIPVKVE